MSLYKKMPVSTLSRENDRSLYPSERVFNFMRKRPRFVASLSLIFLVLLVLILTGPNIYQKYGHKKEIGHLERVFSLHKKAIEVQTEGKVEEGILLLQQALKEKQNPLKDETLFLLGLSYEKTGQLQKALDSYDLLVKEGVSSQIKEQASQRKVWLSIGL